MVRTNGTLPYHCYPAANATDARIGCVPTVPDPLYRCVGQFANTCLKLLQIFFYYRDALHLAQRWVAGHVVVIDATFNTNGLRLPLLVAVGVINENKTFPIAFSYCPGESAESLVFFLESLRASFFIDGVPEPTVVMSDVAASMISAFDTHNAMPRSQLQFCSWHVGRLLRPGSTKPAAIYRRRSMGSKMLRRSW
jgi:MULE transposase domain